MDGPGYCATTPEMPHRARVCTICGLAKPIREFYLRPAPEGPYRRHRQCKDCQKTKARGRDVANPELTRQRMWEYWRSLDAAAREKRRVDNRASYAERAHAAGRTYRPRLNSRTGSEADITALADIRGRIEAMLTRLSKMKSAPWAVKTGLCAFCAS